MTNKYWIHIGLTQKQICFLDKLSKDCKFSGGRKFSRTAILRAFLVIGRELSINLSSVKGEEDLKNKILVAFKDK